MKSLYEESKDALTSIPGQVVGAVANMALPAAATAIFYATVTTSVAKASQVVTVAIGVATVALMETERTKGK